MLAHLLEKVSQELGMSRPSMSCEDPVESEGEDDDDESQSKRPKLNEEDKVQKCRERNRVHARNTRERKRAQMDLLQQRIQELSDEKKQLEEYEPEASVASILMSLSSCSQSDGGHADAGNNHTHSGSSADGSSRTFAADAIERIRTMISATLSDDEELELSSEFHTKDKAQCSTHELETIRRERNRMHAKKTRLRKKKMLTEMEAIITSLEHDVRELKRKHNLMMSSDELADGTDASKAAPGSTTTTAISGGTTATTTSAANKAARQSKFTGFRHLHNKTMGGVTLIDGLRQGPAAFTGLKDKESRNDSEKGLDRPLAALAPSPRVPPLPAFMTVAATMSGPSVQQQQLAQQSAMGLSLAPLVYFPTKGPEVKTENNSSRAKIPEIIIGDVDSDQSKRERDSGSCRSSESGGEGSGGLKKSASLSSAARSSSHGGTTTNSSSDGGSPRSNSSDT